MKSLQNLADEYNTLNVALSQLRMNAIRLWAARYGTATYLKQREASERFTNRYIKCLEELDLCDKYCELEKAMTALLHKYNLTPYYSEEGADITGDILNWLSSIDLKESERVI